MIEQDSGYGNEPTETQRGNENGRVMHDTDMPEYTSQDEHFAAVEHLVDAGVANMADASEQVGYNPADYEDASSVEDELDALFNLPPTPTQGASVSLAERAVAVAQLMDGIAMQNKSSGAHRSNGIANRYRNADEVLDGMGNKADRYRQGEKHAIEVLAKTAAMRAAGFDEHEVLTSRVSVQRELAPYRKTGPKAVAARNKQKTITQRTAENAAGSR